MTRRSVVIVKGGNGHTRSLIRNIYSKSHRRTRGVNIGSIRIDADPDDFQTSIRMTRPTSKTAWVDPALRKLNQADIDSIKAWLILNGDQKAAARRRSRDEAVARQVRRSLEDVSVPNGNALTRLPGLLKEAGVFLADRHKEYVAGGRDFWADHRALFRNVVEAFERFQASAKAVGLVKGSRSRP